MKKMMSMMVVALMVTGSVAIACDTCGCKEKKAEKKSECSSCEAAKKCEKCTEKKTCEGCTKKAAEAKKAKASS